MTMAKISAFESASDAAKYGRELRSAGFEAQISGPLDLVLIEGPGSTVGGWSQAGKTWYLVVGSEKAFSGVQ